VAKEIRKAAASGDQKKVKELSKQLKVKATGEKTIDLVAKLSAGKISADMIDTTHTKLMTQTDVDAEVFIVIDGSGSMFGNMGRGGYYGVEMEPGAPEWYGRIQHIDVCACLALTFMLNNKNPLYQRTFSVFSQTATFHGDATIFSSAKNNFLSGDKFVKKAKMGRSIIDLEAGFSANYRALKSYLRANAPVSSTNIGAVIKLFTDKVKNGDLHVEQLPNVLMFLTDNEHNTGPGPARWAQWMGEIGWQPLLVFWSTQESTGSRNLMAVAENFPNLLVITGFTEGTFSQILRGIKSGSINPYDALWALADDSRYSVLTRKLVGLK
jgi:hypothetical protein